jgi:hypothetical protein
VFAHAAAAGPVTEAAMVSKAAGKARPFRTLIIKFLFSTQAYIHNNYTAVSLTGFIEGGKYPG